MKNLPDILIKGGVAVMPTDTLYGIVASALNSEAVQKVYSIKKRTPTKPFIILISELTDLSLFDITPDNAVLASLKKIWPGKVSVIFSLEIQKSINKFEYLHRGTNTLAFRIPDKSDLRELLKETGPLIAPSANPEGKNPASTIEEAEKYFGDEIGLYVDGGYLSGEPSTLIKIQNGKVEVLREGAVKI